MPDETLPMSMQKEITRGAKRRERMPRESANRVFVGRVDGRKLMERAFSTALHKMIESKAPEWRSIVRRDAKLLRRRGINSVVSLMKTLAQLTGRQRATAVQLLGHCGNRRAVPMLLNLFRSDSGMRLEASQALALLAGDRAFKSLAEILQTESDSDVRYWAAYGLGNMGEKRAWRSLLAALQKDKDPRVRSQAAEGLGEILEYSDQRSPMFRQAVKALIHSLNDVAPEVRFWSAFALGKAKAKIAVPELRRVARLDTAVCPEWWAVKDEAKAAIQVIQGGPWPKRTSSSKCQFG
jgi:HEAT repeat protein